MMSAVVAVVASMLSGCASTPNAFAVKIMEADEKAVEQCKFVGLATGSSMLGGAAQKRARENAKVGALEEAAEKGATHIVWTELKSTRSDGAFAQGRAYRCE